ncbi:MAG: amino acid permease [Candidatus Rokuibacteriota bacterium]|nr:MAG: amino acid permease [Candidatus Rokubacteria bacterium]
MTPTAETTPRAVLGLRDAIGLIVGTVVGVGIFRTPSLVAEHAGSMSVALLAWLVGGLVSLLGALCYAELASAYPNTGGDYHYLTRAFGRKLGFLFAWARLSVVQTGAIALLAFVLGDYANEILQLGPWGSPLCAGVIVVALTATNILGVRQGATTQNVLTALEVTGFLLIVLAGLAAQPAAAAVSMSGAAASPGTFGLVMVFVLLTYGGWNEAAYLSGEVRDPGRTMVRALVWSLGLVTALYLLINWTFLATLGVAGVAGSKAVAADVVQVAFGPQGARLTGGLVVVAALTSINAAIFTGARSSYAVGRDFGALGFLGRWHPITRTPVNALLTQGVMALALVGLGGLTRSGFETMVEYTAPVFWLFLCLTGVALFVLRRRDPARPRPFRVPFYPLTPLAFCVTSGYLVYSSLAYTGIGALVGVAVLAAGTLGFALTKGGS